MIFLSKDVSVTLKGVLNLAEATFKGELTKEQAGGHQVFGHLYEDEQTANLFTKAKFEFHGNAHSNKAVSQFEYDTKKDLVLSPSVADGKLYAFGNLSLLEKLPEDCVGYSLFQLEQYDLDRVVPEPPSSSLLPSD